MVTREEVMFGFAFVAVLPEPEGPKLRYGTGGGRLAQKALEIDNQQRASFVCATPCRGGCSLPVAPKLVLKLKGGLGNQMFQYAAALGIASRRGLDLVLDTRSGFARDRVYKRHFSLGHFGLRARRASSVEEAAFLFEDAIRSTVGSRGDTTLPRPWGAYRREDTYRYHSDLTRDPDRRSLWLDGYWQCESYFSHVARQVLGAFELSTPTDARFSVTADEVRRENAVAVGVRLYEEAPAGSHDRVPFEYYERVAAQLSRDIKNPVFYVFCTVRDPIRGRLALPGPIRYVTHDDGYIGEAARLWLLTQFRYHILSNSSFYWWGAWLAEMQREDAVVIASDNFPNPDTIPDRWLRQAP